MSKNRTEDKQNFRNKKNKLEKSTTNNFSIETKVTPEQHDKNKSTR